MTVDQVLNAQPTPQIQVSNGPTLTSRIPFDAVRVCFFKDDQDLSSLTYKDEGIIQLDLENADPDCEFQISAMKGGRLVGVLRGSLEILREAGTIPLIHRLF